MHILTSNVRFHQKHPGKSKCYHYRWRTWRCCSLTCTRHCWQILTRIPSGYFEKCQEIWSTKSFAGKFINADRRKQIIGQRNKKKQLGKTKDNEMQTRLDLLRCRGNIKNNNNNNSNNNSILPDTPPNIRYSKFKKCNIGTVICLH